MPERSALSPSRIAPAVVAVVALGSLAWWLAPRPTAWRTPVALGKGDANPEDVRRDGGVWFWIERPVKGKDARLVRAVPGSLQRIATAEAIGSYALTDGDTIVWSARTGAQWSVVQASRDGKSPKTLWTGPDEPQGLASAGNTLYWIRRTAPRIPQPGPFPALDSSLEVVSLAAGAAAPSRVATLPESKTGRVLGRWGDGLAVACFRTDYPGSTGLYRVPLSGGAPARFHSAVRQSRPLLTRAGVLYGVEPSEEAAPPLDSMVLLEFSPDGRARPVSDWLPLDGAPVDTGRAVLFADREIPSALWQIRGIDALPAPVEPPDGFYGVSAGDGALLLMRKESTRETPDLFEVPAP